MNRIVVALALTAGLLSSSTAWADTVELQINSASGPGITFQNSAFTFVTGFAATAETLNGVTSYNDPITGSFTNGTFQFNSSGQVSANPNAQLVLTSALAGNSSSVTAQSVVFSTISVNTEGNGSGGSIFSTTVTLSDFVPTAPLPANTTITDPYLAALVADNGQMSVTFTWSSVQYTVAGLADPNTDVSISYQGDISDPVAPAPTSWAMLATGVGLLGGFGVVRRRRTLSLA